MSLRSRLPARREPARGAVAGPALLAGATLLGIGLALYWRNRFDGRGSRDSAPGHTARRSRFGGYTVIGRSVTIHADRGTLYDQWRDFGNLPRFMENVKAVRTEGDVSTWTIAAPRGSVTVKTRIVSDRPGEEIAWRSTEDSDIDTEGKVSFRDAPGGRGTVVEARIAYRQPGGAVGRGAAFLTGTDPRQQARRDLKRFKMLMETGEVTSSRLR